MEDHAGSLTFEDRADAGGARVSLRLPATAVGDNATDEVRADAKPAA